MPSFLVDGHRVDSDADLHSELAQAHARRIRPRCLCSNEHPAMVVARLGPTYILKRMPGTGAMHASSCVSHGVLLSKRVRTPSRRPAIQHDPQTGETAIRLDCALGLRRSSVEAAPHAVNAPSARAALSLRDLLFFLWDEAGLTRWHPGFAGKRSWAVVRSHLLGAAVGKTVNGRKLSAILCVPEVFSVQRQPQIEERRRQCWDTASGNRRHRLLIVGEMKRFIARETHSQLLLKHLPDQPLGIASERLQRMQADFKHELSLWVASGDVRMVVIASVELGARPSAVIVECALLPLDANWLPVARTNQQAYRRVQGPSHPMKLVG
jgi:hypothetical protein